MRGRAAALVLPALVTLHAAAQAPPALSPLPEVSVERMDPAVARQLRELAAAAPESAAAWGALGQLYLVNELYEPAESALGNAQALEPAEPRWPYLRGAALQELRRLDEAAAHLERALELRAGDPAATLRLAQVELERGRPERAGPLLQRGLADAGTRAAAHFGLGRLEAARRRWAEAARHFEAALAAQPQATAPRHPLALAYRELGELDRARAALRGAGSVPVQFSDPWVEEARRRATGSGVHALRALEAAARGNDPRALEELRRAAALDPANPELRQGLAEALERQGEGGAALAEFREAVRLAPDSPLAHMNLGLALARRGELAAALGALERSVELAPDLALARLRLGTVLLQSGRAADALAQLERAVALDPAGREARLRRARALR
ncbi:MAG TPA: tetratricopeptide repeat protein, partial [Thermoanaerobaculia bacterium]|nr:tetratricopeptide repeat protein [Thermoanaerobaculia bacterium]